MPRRPRLPETASTPSGAPAVAPGGASPGLSQEDAATRVPCAQATISRYVRRGQLTQLPNGRLDECAVEEARALIKANEAGGEMDGDMKRRLDEAMARLREAQAELREIELERESGRFIERVLVEQDASDARERILAVLRAIPQRVAMQVDAALTAPFDRRAAVVEKIIAEEVERAVAELSEAKYGAAK